MNRLKLLSIFPIILLPLANCKLINEYYIRTFPEDISINFPEGRVLSCLSNCPDKGCNCFRISKDTSDTNCEYEIADVSNNDKFIYYALDRYNSTFTGGKNLVDPNKITKSAGTSETESATTTHPWIQFDLTKEYVITGIQIRSNKEWALSEIRVGKQSITEAFNTQPFEGNPLCAKKELSKRNFNGNDLIPCKPCPLAGRYVVIQKHPSRNDYQLSSDAIQIFGF
ncbi:uncharacterized protein LOC107371221 [Tetranychus urticae]|uniref:uncharacterized protein LOC107371221 n=1 Tax=Tetranychus urticae TaxID=32264 RepID=UPI00077BBB03|nr:uncharacterized protein LOC107371221 [Tetranychus urticae]